MAITQSEAVDGTTSATQGAARFAREAVGNFVLVFAFGAAIATHTWFAPLLIAAPLIALVYIRSRAPGGHYNPALTLAMLIRGRLTLRDALGFWLAQLSGGLAAAATVRAFVDPTQLAITAAMTVQGITLVAAFAVQLIVTCALCCVALDVPTVRAGTVDPYRSWPIAISVIATAIAISAVTTGAFDPAVGLQDPVSAILGPVLWVYLVSQLLSGIATTITFVSVAEHR